MGYRVLVGSMCLSLHNSRSNFQSKKFVPSGMRKRIRGFSKDARRNLLKQLQSVDYEELNAQFWNAYFITLTYQYSVEEGKEDFYFTWKNDLNKVKKDLDIFYKRLDRFFKRLGVEWFSFWKMEFFERAPVPHFHLILFLSPRDDISQKTLKEIIPLMWVDVITKGTGVSDELKERMLVVSTNVRYSPINKYDILQVYISKEIGKEYQIDIEGYTGRFWGIAKRGVFKRFYLEERFLISEDTFYRLRRVFVKYLRKLGYNARIRSSNGMSLYYIMNRDNFIRLINYFEGFRDVQGDS